MSSAAKNLESRILELEKLIEEKDTEITLHKNQVQELEDVLRTFISSGPAESTIQSKRVLLADSNPKQQIIAKLALGGSGVELDMVSDVKAGEEKIDKNKYDLVFLDVAMMELGNFVKARYPHAGLVLMTSQDIPTYLPTLKTFDGIPNIVSREESDRTFTVKSIMTTVTKLLTHDLFGLEKYLSWGVDVQSEPVLATNQRSDLIEKADKYFELLGIRRSNRDRMRVVLEEMLMNAIYDAPVSAEGTPAYNHLQRTVDFELKIEERGTLRFATDGAVFAVSVEDPFGSLNGRTILKYLEHNYDGTAASLNAQQNKAGAGRGLHQIVENSDLVVFNIDPGKKTEVIALFNVEMKQSGPKNPAFHLFIKPSN